MTTFYFTFGVGSPLANYYVPIVAADENDARCAMYMLFSRHWASCYTEPPRSGVPLAVNYQGTMRLQSAPDVEVPLEIYSAGCDVLNNQP